MGKLTMELVAERTLAESEVLVRATGLPVKSIAYEPGFNDQAHFAGWFRKHSCMSTKNFKSC